jgi:hypothetical protein
VNAPDSYQGLVVEALGADGQPVDACGPVSGRRAALDRARIRLHRYLGICGYGQAPRDSVEQTTDLGRRKQARRATAQKYRFDRAPTRALRFALEVD